MAFRGYYGGLSLVFKQTPPQGEILLITCLLTKTDECLIRRLGGRLGGHLGGRLGGQK